MNEELKKLLETIKAEENSEFKGELKTMFKTEFDVNHFKSFAETDEGKKYINSVADSRTTKGIDTFKENTMPGVIKEKVESAIEEFKKSAGITLSPEQEEIKKLKAEHEELKAQLLRDNTALALEATRGRSKLPSEFKSLVKGSTPEDLQKNLEAFQTVYASEVDRIKKSAIDEAKKQFGFDPNKGGNPPAKITSGMLEKAAEKAQATGNEDDFMEFIKIKNAMAEQNNKQ